MRERYIYQPQVMAAAPVEKQTEYVEAGAVTFGIEYRILDAAIRAASYGRAVTDVKSSDGTGSSQDKGVTIHVFEDEGGKRSERLRFDCFEEDPHYHYINAADSSNELLGIDPSADGDPLAWALERIRTRLPQMLARSGAEKLAKRVDQSKVDEALAKVAEAAYRARFHSDEKTIHDNAVNR